MLRHFHQIDWIAEINGDFIKFTNSLFPVLHLVIHFGEILASSSEVKNFSNLLSTSNRIHDLVNFHLRINGFLFLDKIRAHDIMVDGRLKWINLTCFAILNVNLTPLNSRGNRKTTWNLDVLEFLVLKKLLHTYSEWQNMTNFRSLRYPRQRICSWPLPDTLFIYTRPVLYIVVPSSREK